MTYNKVEYNNNFNKEKYDTIRTLRVNRQYQAGPAPTCVGEPGPAWLNILDLPSLICYHGTREKRRRNNNER